MPRPRPPPTIESARRPRLLDAREHGRCRRGRGTPAPGASNELRATSRASSSGYALSQSVVLLPLAQPPPLQHLGREPIVILIELLGGRDAQQQQVGGAAVLLGRHPALPPWPSWAASVNVRHAGVLNLLWRREIPVEHKRTLEDLLIENRIREEYIERSSRAVMEHRHANRMAELGRLHSQALNVAQMRAMVAVARTIVATASTMVHRFSAEAVRFPCAAMLLLLLLASGSGVAS